MAGHSKWANIKHKKAKEDKKRGKVFTKLIREITVAAKLGGSEQSSNPRLRAAVLEAFGQNMPKDTIERAIKRGAGDGDDSNNIEEILYEGYGPGGVACLVYTFTDNRNRTVSEVRHAFTKCGGNLGTDGSVAYLFSKVGLIVSSPGVDEEYLTEQALNVGVDDINENTDGSFDIITSWEQVHDIRAYLEDKQINTESAEVIMLPANQISVDVDTAYAIIRLIEMLEDLDDVQNVYFDVEY